MEKHKVTIIYGDDDVARNMSDGQIISYGDLTKDMHVGCLLDFLKEKYGNLEMVKKLSAKYSPETIAFVVTTFGHIVFLNLIGNGVGKVGVLLLPWTISEKQKNSLEKLVETLKDFDYYILYNLKLDEGMLVGLEYECLHPEMLKFVNEFANNKEELTKKSAPYN